MEALCRQRFSEASPHRKKILYIRPVKQCHGSRTLAESFFIPEVLPCSELPGGIDDLRNAEAVATLIRHEQALFAQAQQSAACNASHTVEARLSRWLLRSRELAGSNALGLTQEFVAQMLGVRRTSVSLVANTLQNAGLIRYSRGRIQITDLDGLRAASCECYGRVKAQYDRLLNSGTK